MHDCTADTRSSGESSSHQKRASSVFASATGTSATDHTRPRASRCAWRLTVLGMSRLYEALRQMPSRAQVTLSTTRVRSVQTERAGARYLLADQPKKLAPS